MELFLAIFIFACAGYVIKVFVENGRTSEQLEDEKLERLNYKYEYDLKHVCTFCSGEGTIWDCDNCYEKAVVINDKYFQDIVCNNCHTSSLRDDKFTESKCPICDGSGKPNLDWENPYQYD